MEGKRKFAIFVAHLLVNKVLILSKAHFMSTLRILYAASEISPFLETSAVADFVKALPKYMQEQELEVRIMVPRFGVINERKNRLHEVVRLSGLNINVGDDEAPLVIKVASIPQAKLQVYFIDNEDYFKRKAVLHDKENKFFEDNDARMIFFCKGVLETVKKLGWAPDIVHCHDWMASLLPLYLKTAYRKEPLFKKSKVVFTLYNNTFTAKLSQDLPAKAKMVGVKEEALSSLATADFGGLIRTGIQHADRVFSAEPLTNKVFEGILEEEVACIENNEEGLAAYHKLYKELIGAR